MEQAINPDSLAQLRDLMGDALDDVLRTFIDYMPEQVDSLSSAINAKDADAVFNVAHKMKSSCGSIGATGLAQVAEEIEMIGRAGSTENTMVLFEKFRDLYTEVDALLKAELEK